MDSKKKISRNRNITGMYKCKNEFEKKYQARTKLLKDVNYQNILTGGRITSVV
jgi:hypothetical protein